MEIQHNAKGGEQQARTHARPIDKPHEGREMIGEGTDSSGLLTGVQMLMDSSGQ